MTEKASTTYSIGILSPSPPGIFNNENLLFAVLLLLGSISAALSSPVLKSSPTFTV